MGLENKFFPDYNKMNKSSETIDGIKVCRILDIFIDPSIVGYQSEFYHFEYPVRPSFRRYRLDEVRSVRIKPLSQRSEINVPFDNLATNIDMAENSKKSNTSGMLKLYSNLLQPSDMDFVACLCSNKSDDIKIYLHPINYIIELRPKFDQFVKEIVLEITVSKLEKQSIMTKILFQLYKNTFRFPEIIQEKENENINGNFFDSDIEITQNKPVEHWVNLIFKDGREERLKVLRRNGKSRIIFTKSYQNLHMLENNLNFSINLIDVNFSVLSEYGEVSILRNDFYFVPNNGSNKLLILPRILLIFLRIFVIFVYSHKIIGIKSIRLELFSSEINMQEILNTMTDSALHDLLTLSETEGMKISNL